MILYMMADTLEYTRHYLLETDVLHEISVVKTQVNCQTCLHCVLMVIRYFLPNYLSYIVDGVYKLSLHCLVPYKVWSVLRGGGSLFVTAKTHDIGSIVESISF